MVIAPQHCVSLTNTRLSYSGGVPCFAEYGACQHMSLNLLLFYRQYFGYGALQAPVQIEREDEKEAGVLRTSTCSEFKIFRSHIEPFGDFVDSDGKRYSLSRVEARFTPRMYFFAI